MAVRLGWLIAFLITASSSYAQGPAILQNSGHSSSITGFAAAPDARWFASASADGAVKLWDTASGRLLRTLKGHLKKVSGVAVTPDGKRVVSISEDESIRIWDAESGALVRSIAGLTEQSDFIQDGLALSPDGRFAYSFSLEAIRKTDLASSALQKKFAKPGTFAMWNAFALSSDGRYIAAAHAGAVNASAKNAAIGAQVKLLDAETGRLIRTFGTYSEKESVRSLSFSPDGKLVAAGGGEGIVKLWDVATGKLLLVLAHSQTASSKYITQVGFTPDSRTLVTAGGPESIRFWDAISGQPQGSLGDERRRWSSVFAFVPAKNLLLSANGPTITATNLSSKAIEPISFGAADTYSVSLAPLGADRWIEFASTGLSLWDARRGQLIQTLEPRPGYVVGSQPFWAKDSAGDVLLAATFDQKEFSIKVWKASGTLLWKLQWEPRPRKEKPCRSCVNGYSLQNVTISPDGRWLAANLFGDDSGLVRLWDLTTGAQSKVIATGGGGQSSPNAWPNAAANHMVFSPDSRSLVVGMFDAKVRQWIKVFDVETGRATNSFELKENPGVGRVNNYRFTISPDGRTLAMQYVLYGRGGRLQADNMIATIELATGRLLRTFTADGIEKDAQLIAYSPDGHLIVTGNFNSERLNVWAAESGRLVKQLEGNPGSPWSIAFSNDRQRLAVGNMNGTSSVWDLRSFERLTMSFHAGSGEWVTITPEGFFAASEHGAELLHVVTGMQTIGIEQFYQSLYRPDLVREKLAGDPAGLVRQAAATLDLSRALASGPAPEVRLTLSGSPGGPVSAAASASIEAEIAERGGGIGRIEWRVNGVTVGLDRPAASAQPVRLNRTVSLAAGENVVEVVAYNAADLIASLPGRVSITLAPAPAAAPDVPAPQPPAEPRPRLFALVAGINEYADRQIRLSYAVPDASEVARALQEAGTGLHESLHVRLLTDAEVTRKGLERAFREIAEKAWPSDVFVFYLAGHGKTVDGRYYFIPQEFAMPARASEAAVNQAVQAGGITQAELQGWFAMIAARKSVIFFDTCESGTLTEEGAETRHLALVAANDRLAQATGRSIITASAGDEEALEGYHGHGLFTYELLEAIEQGDSDRNGTVEIAELGAYVHARVSELSDRIFNHRQAPQIRIKGNYALARQLKILPHEIGPVAQAEPDYKVADVSELQVEAAAGATVVRSLQPGTGVRVIGRINGWALVAADGKPLGYVPGNSLAPLNQR